MGVGIQFVAIGPPMGDGPAVGSGSVDIVRPDQGPFGGGIVVVHADGLAITQNVSESRFPVAIARRGKHGAAKLPNSVGMRKPARGGDQTDEAWSVLVEGVWKREAHGLKLAGEGFCE